MNFCAPERREWSHIDDATFDSFDFIVQARRHLGSPHSEIDQFHLPASTMPDRLTLCLDLDDTLTLMKLCPIMTEEGEEIEHDSIVTAQDNPSDWGRVYFRPFVRGFLLAVSKVFEVVVFTAACREYADQILNVLDPEGSLIHHRLYRESCQECQWNPAKVYVKDLRVLGRNLSKVVLVDNSILCAAFQLDNCLIVNPFKGDRTDIELIRILAVLREIENLHKLGNFHVRDVLYNIYRLSDCVDFYDKVGGRGGVRTIGEMNKILGGRVLSDSGDDTLQLSPPSSPSLKENTKWINETVSLGANSYYPHHQAPVKSCSQYPLFTTNLSPPQSFRQTSYQSLPPPTIADLRYSPITNFRSIPTYPPPTSHHNFSFSFTPSDLCSTKNFSTKSSRGIGPVVSAARPVASLPYPGARGKSQISNYQVLNNSVPQLTGSPFMQTRGVYDTHQRVSNQGFRFY